MSDDFSYFGLGCGQFIGNLMIGSLQGDIHRGLGIGIIACILCWIIGGIAKVLK